MLCTYGCECERDGAGIEHENRCKNGIIYLFGLFGIRFLRRGKTYFRFAVCCRVSSGGRIIEFILEFTSVSMAAGVVWNCTRTNRDEPHYPHFFFLEFAGETEFNFLMFYQNDPGGGVSGRDREVLSVDCAI